MFIKAANLQLSLPGTGEVEGAAEAGLTLVRAFEVALELSRALLRRVCGPHHVQKSLRRGHVQHGREEVGGRGAAEYVTSGRR